MNYAADTQKSTKFKQRVFLHIFLLLSYWMLLTKIVIPWDKSKQYPKDCHALLEGQKAYAELIRAEKPAFVTVVRGLNMVNAEYIQNKTNTGREINFGNVRVYFDTHDEFSKLEIKY